MPKQLIDFIFSSYRRQMLAVLLLRPDEQFHVRQLERLTGISAGSLHRELKAMAAAGLLRRETQGNQVLYQVERECPIYEELASIFRKTVGMAMVLREGLLELEDRIDIAFVFGSMATGNQHVDSDLDLCVLGEVELFDVVKALGTVQANFRREINPAVMSTTKYLSLLATQDRFIERLDSEPKVFVIGGEREFRKLIEDWES